MTAALAFLFLSWAALLASVVAVAAARARPPHPFSARPPGPVVLIRPIAGAPPTLARALASTARAKLPAGTRVRLSTYSGDDPGAPIARQVAGDLAAEGLDALAVTAPGPGLNHKVAQLAWVREREPDARVLLIADADVCLEDVDLEAFLAPLAAANAGAVWSPISEGDGVTLGDRASAALLGGSLHAFPLLRGIDPSGLVGKLFAVRADALDSFGGFATLADLLGEDMALAEALLARGRTVTARPTTARSLSEGRSFEAAAARYTRWLAVVRTQRPGRRWAYPALFLGTLPVVLGGLGVAALGRPWEGTLALALALSARLFASTAAAARAGRPPGLLPRLKDVVLADALLWRAWWDARRAPAVHWAGRTLVVGPGGRLSLAEEVAG